MGLLVSIDNTGIPLSEICCAMMKFFVMLWAVLLSPRRGDVGDVWDVDADSDLNDSETYSKLNAVSQETAGGMTPPAGVAL